MIYRLQCTFYKGDTDPGSCDYGPIGLYLCTVVYKVNNGMIVRRTNKVTTKIPKTFEFAPIWHTTRVNKPETFDQTRQNFSNSSINTSPAFTSV